MNRRRGRFPIVRIVGIAAALVLVLLLLPRLGPNDAVDGELWRRGLLQGDQVRLLRDGRYEIQHWSRFGADETVESGTWVQLGEVVSLVPSGGGKPARLLRKRVQDERWYLSDPAERGGDARYERVD